MLDTKRTTPVFQGLTKPILMMGAERENIIIIVFFAGIVWFAGKDFVATLIAVLVWTVGVFVSRVAAKNDPYQTKIFLRSSKYENFYPAREKLITPPRAQKKAGARYHV